ncbi:MAG: transglycosylase SLT domain-containing protein [Acidobacteriota bacterium]|nr:transglycosylase SLT domain-containing protein [Acidobacteriota bacterium]
MKNLILAIIIVFVFSLNLPAQVYNDATLAKVREQDRTSRDVSGRLQTLTAEEHNYRADVYSTNRYFKEAREHWQKILDHYRADTVLVPKALFGIARSYMWERQYEKAVAHFDTLTRDYLNTKEGREGLAFKGASYVRMSKHGEAVKTYEQYTVMFPTGEKIESSFLNIIDSLREAKRYDEANAWVEKARQRFMGKPTETNALHARLRMEIHRGDWNKAILAADTLRDLGNFRGSMTSLDEANYLKAFALEKAGRRAEAVAVYSSIPDTLNSYYGGLATERLKALSPSAPRVTKTASVSASLIKDFPAPYRTELLRYARPRGIDPRFMLAIMKQESSFRANAKSPAAARGLLQLVFDTALKYNKQAGFPNLQAEDLYRPDVNIAIASVYIDELLKEFGNLYEAVAASYNGGEDNAARWLNRSKPKEAGIFSSEVGFSESKNYVYKVMNNYRIYRELYTEDLQRR